MPDPAQENPAPPDRDSLALQRTRLANERTALAYLRTAIMFVATGGTLLKVFADTPGTVTLGWGLIAVGVGIGLLGALRFKKLADLLG